MWLCAACGRYVGSHRDGWPLGVPADKETRDARKAAHAAFDPIWKPPTGHGYRREAYQWLAAALGRPGEEIHIGEMTAETARRVVTVVRERPADPGDPLGF